MLDPATGAYRVSAGQIAPDVLAIVKNRDAGARFAQLRASAHPQAQFMWAIFRDLFHYVAVHLADFADNARDVDLALRWGFGWTQGAFETWQTAGWQAIAEAIQADLDGGRTMSAVALPAWVLARAKDGGVHGDAGSYSASADALRPRSTLPVYRRQLFPERLAGESVRDGDTVWENDGVRLWTLPQSDAGIAIVSVKTKHHTLGRDVILGLREALARAAAEFQAVVIWHEAPFAFGANLKEVVEAFRAGQFNLLETYIGEFQKTSLAIKYAPIPVVAAVQGMAWRSAAATSS